MDLKNEKTINRILKEAGVDLPAELIKVSSRGSLGVYKSTRNNKKIIIKIVTKDYKEKYQNLIKEYEADQFLKEIDIDDKILRPKLLEKGEDDDYFWIIREYVEGTSWVSGEDRSDILLGNDQIDLKYEKDFELILNSIINYLKIFESATVPEELEQRKQRFSNDIDTYHIEYISKGIDRNIDQAISFYKQNFGKYSDKSSQIISSGDLVPSNIIISPTKKIYLSDFEWLSVDNKMFDVVILWLFLWKYKNLQDLIINNMIESSKDKIDFQLTLIRVIIAWFDTHFQTEISSNELETSNRNKCKNHIWSLYLERARSIID